MNSKIRLIFYWLPINFLYTCNAEVLTISTKGCTIPSFNDNSKTKKPLEDSIIDYKCPSVLRLVSSNKTHLWVIKDAFEEFNIWNEDYFHCCYKSFAAIGNISNIIYEECKLFSNSIKVENQFVRIQCYYDDEVIFEDFFLFHIENALNKKYSTDKNMFNVIILGLESMSRMNFHRTMRQTSKYLRDHGAVEFRGYNKLGDNSFPNLFPIFTGKSYKSIKNKLKNEPEKLHFIWHDFKQAGYTTAMASDSIAGLLGSYEYNFGTIPADHYLQPFIFETRNVFQDKRFNFHKCLGDKFFYKIFLDFISSITSNSHLLNFFGLFWEESISHDDLKLPIIMDEDYVNVLKLFENKGFLQNSIIIFFSDHGTRWGEFVETRQGRLEERLPLLSILLPEKFKRRYTLAYKNLQQNSYRLTTPFDFHKTLLHLLDLSQLDDKVIKERLFSNENKKESSLFLPVSPRRTCKDVGILQHWCSCYNGRSLHKENRDSILAGQHIILHVNSLLKKSHECRQLKLKEVISANVEKHVNEEIFRVVIKSSPGTGIFESTLHRIQNQWIVSDIVSRLNTYRNESYCVHDEIIKLYCVCK